MAARKLSQFSNGAHTHKKQHIFLVYSMEFHSDQLQNCCRVCGKRLLKAKGSKGKSHVFDCFSNSQELLDAFGIDMLSDDSSIHPPQFCLACHCVARKKRESVEEHTVYRGKSLEQHIFRWEPHKLQCTVSIKNIPSHKHNKDLNS